MPYSSSCRQLHVPVLLSKVPQAGCLKTTDTSFLQVLEGRKSRDQGPTGFSFCGFPFPLAGSHFLSRVHVACLPCVHMDPEPASFFRYLFS